MLPNDQILAQVGRLVFLLGGVVLLALVIFVAVLFVYWFSNVALTKLLKTFKLFDRVLKVSARMFEEDRRKKQGQLTIEEALKREYDGKYGYLLSEATRLVKKLAKSKVCPFCGYEDDGIPPDESTTYVNILRIRKHHLGCALDNVTYQLATIHEQAKQEA